MDSRGNGRRQWYVVMVMSCHYRSGQQCQHWLVLPLAWASSLRCRQCLYLTWGKFHSLFSSLIKPCLVSLSASSHPTKLTLCMVDTSVCVILNIMFSVTSVIVLGRLFMHFLPMQKKQKKTWMVWKWDLEKFAWP